MNNLSTGKVFLLVGFGSAVLERSSKVVGLPTYQPAKDCKDQLPSNRWLKEPFKNLTQGGSLNNKEFLKRELSHQPFDDKKVV